MKHKLYLIVFLLCSSVQAQKFEFDLLTKYEVTVENDKRDRIVYSNSNNQNYFLTIYNEMGSDEKVAVLYDLKTNFSHKLNVAESTVNNEVFYSFSYKDTDELPLKVSVFDNEYKYTTLKNDTLKKEVKIEVFKNLKSKKPEMYLIVKMKKNSVNLFPLYRFSCFHPFELNQKLNISENYIVESAEGVTLSGKKYTHKLIDKIDIKLVVEIPK